MIKKTLVALSSINFKCMALFKTTMKTTCKSTWIQKLQVVKLVFIQLQPTIIYLGSLNTIL